MSPCFVLTKHQQVVSTPGGVKTLTHAALCLWIFMRRDVIFDLISLISSIDSNHTPKRTPADRFILTGQTVSRPAQTPSGSRQFINANLQRPIFGALIVNSCDSVPPQALRQWRSALVGLPLSIGSYIYCFVRWERYISRVSYKLPIMLLWWWWLILWGRGVWYMVGLKFMFSGGSMQALNTLTPESSHSPRP